LIIDIRYHIITLVAVFLMLGLGILIGTSMVGNETLTKQQEQLANRLEKQLNALRLENLKVQERYERVQAEREALDAFAQEVVPYAIGGRLRNMRVAVFEVGQTAPPELLDDLKTAGATVGPVVTLLNGLDVTGSATKISIDLGWPEKEAGAVATRLAGELGRAIATGQNPSLVHYLVEERLVRVTGDSALPVRGAVIVGALGGGEESQRPDLALVDGLLTEGVTVVGVGSGEGAGKGIRDYQKRKISTVEDIRTPWGRIGMVLALSGQPGHYAAGAGEKRFLPPYPGGDTR